MLLPLPCSLYAQQAKIVKKFTILAYSRYNINPYVISILYDPIMEKEYITIDTNQHNALLEQTIFDYADVAYSSGYKDVQLVFPPLLFMERTNYHLHLEQLKTKRMVSESDTRLLANRRRVHISSFSDVDYDYMQALSDGFKQYLKTDIQEQITPEAIERIKKAAFTIKQAKDVLPQDPPYDSCPASYEEINPFDFDDLAVTAALYSVSDTRKYVHPHLKKTRFNSADYSMIAAFENHLSDIVTTPEERQARTIFVSNDNMLQDELIKAAQSAGDIRKAQLHNRESMMKYIQGELKHILKHMELHPVKLDPSDQQALERLKATLFEWAGSQKGKGSGGHGR